MVDAPLVVIFCAAGAVALPVVTVGVTVYGMVPPVTVTRTLAALSWQRSCVTVQVPATKAVGCTTVTFAALNIHKLASLMVKVYVPAAILPNVVPDWYAPPFKLYI